MVKLRLRRKGRVHHPIYDIVAVDIRAPRDGAFLEKVGYYDPNTRPNTIDINPERVIYWLNNGAQPTDTVKNLLSYEGVLLQRHLMLKGKSQPEIDVELEKHKQVVNDRYDRRRQLRKKRVEDKLKAKEEEEKAESKAPAAEAVSKETSGTSDKESNETAEAPNAEKSTES